MSWPQCALGFKELTFSSSFDDATRMREALANEILRDGGIAAPRVAFYRIVVNTGTRNESWGVYTLVEDPADPAMLAARFGGASGNLYKPDGPGGTPTAASRTTTKAALSRALEVRAWGALRAGEACGSNPRVADASCSVTQVRQAVSAFDKTIDFQTAVTTLLASVDARRAHIEAALSR